MPPYVIQIIALFGAVIIGIIFLMEAYKWRQLAEVLSAKQRMLRIWLILIIEAMFGMMFVGPLITGHKHYVAELVYWAICMLLGMAIVILALIDLREVVNNYRTLNRQLYRDLRGDDRQEK